MYSDIPLLKKKRKQKKRKKGVRIIAEAIISFSIFHTWSFFCLGYALAAAIS